MPIEISTHRHTHDNQILNKAWNKKPFSREQQQQFTKDHLDEWIYALFFHRENKVRHLYGIKVLNDFFFLPLKRREMWLI